MINDNNTQARTRLVIDMEQDLINLVKSKAIMDNMTLKDKVTELVKGYVGIA